MRTEKKDELDDEEISIFFERKKRGLHDALNFIRFKTIFCFLFYSF